MTDNALIAGVDIKRGDVIKLVDGKIVPALIDEPHLGAASDFIPEGCEAQCAKSGHWRPTRPLRRKYPPRAMRIKRQDRQ